VSQPNTHQKLTNLDVLNFARDWYEALDRHDPVDAVSEFLDDDDLTMRFPEGTFHGIAGFRRWYDKVINRFFDEVHRVNSVEVNFDDSGVAQVDVAVNWQARVWNPPAAASTWLGFDATQSWTVATVEGRPRITEYAVKDLKPMSGSGAL